MNRLRHISSTASRLHGWDQPRERPIRPIFLRGDSDPLSPDYAEIIRLEKRRATLLALSILCLLVVAACIYLAQS